MVAGGAVVTSPAAAGNPAPAWVQSDPGVPPCSASCAASPPGRYAAAMAYDDATSQLVLFGGFTRSGVLNDTWVWNGSTWAQVDDSPVGCTDTCAGSPPARGYAVMAYDAATSQLILFGGRYPEAGDTWDWNGSTWTRLSPATSPPARDSATMAYDAQSSRLVLFGGDDGTHVRNDTWVWNGTTWTQVDDSPVGCVDTCAGSPPARQLASMASAPGAGGGVVLFGGETGNNVSTNLDDTWVWNGTTWTQVDASPAGCTDSCADSPSPRQAAAMASGTVQGVATVALFGGLDANAHELGDTWAWSPTGGWTQADPGSSPSARDTPALSYDARTAQLVLFGGESSGLLDDTWTYGTAANSNPIGYRLVGGDGGVFCFGNDTFYGSLPGLHVSVGDIRGMATTSTDAGYWLVGADGGVFAFGNAAPDGSLPGRHVTVDDISGIAADPTGTGYWLVGADGGVFAFGNAPYLGSLPGSDIVTSDIVGIASTPDGAGYWLVGADGRVYPYGDASGLGSEAGHPLNAPITGIATPAGSSQRYYLVGQDGGVFAFGGAVFEGSEGAQPAASTVVAIVPTPDGRGYWLAEADGAAVAFGDAVSEGSTGPLFAPITGAGR